MCPRSQTSGLINGWCWRSRSSSETGSTRLSVRSRASSSSGSTPPRGIVRALSMGLLANSLDEEGDPHQGAPLVEILPAQARGHHVDRLDVAQRLAGVVERRLHRTVGAVRRASDDFDDLRDGHAGLLRSGVVRRLQRHVPLRPMEASRAEGGGYLDTSRLSPGEYVGMGAGVVLFLSLFLPWFTTDGSNPNSRLGGATGGDGVNAWHVFSSLDILL